MWRSFFLAAGLYSCILGAQCLAVEKAVLTSRQPQPTGALSFMRSTLDATRNREIIPPDWAPWTLMSAGAVTILYSFTIPKRGEAK